MKTSSGREKIPCLITKKNSSMSVSHEFMPSPDGLLRTAIKLINTFVEEG